MPIIILEGIDGSGKSTLAKKIAEASPLKTTLLHRGPIQHPVKVEYVDPLFRVNKNELLIADRWHVGEVIYGPIYRGVSQVEKFLGSIEEILDHFRAVKVIMSPPLELVKTRLEERGEDYLQPEHVETVYQAYENYATQWGWHVIRDENAESRIPFLLEAAMKGQDRA
jgi:thymidylate kinase